MVGFLYPLGLFSLLSIAGVAFLYFFVFRGRLIEVSSLHLWKLDKSFKMEGKEKKKPPITWPLVLEVASALLLSLLAAGIMLIAPSEAPRLTVILDSSASMNASWQGDSPVNRAVEQVKSCFDLMGDDGLITIIQSGFEPRVLGAELMDKNEALSFLDSWRPSSSTHPMKPAIELAHALAGKDAAPLLITDHDISEKGAITLAVGAPLENTGFINSHWISNDKLFALVSHFGDDKPKKIVTIYGDDTKLGEEELDFSKSDTIPFSVSAPPSISTLTLKLPRDSLENDNILVTARPRILTVSMGLDLNDQKLAQQILRASEACARIVLSNNENPAVLFCRNFCEAPAPFKVRFHDTAATEPFTGPFRVADNHALTQGVALQGAIWRADPKFKAKGARILLAAGDVPLVALDREGLIFNIAADGSNIFTMPLWPVLIANIAEYRHQMIPGIKRFSYRLGENFAFEKPDDWEGQVDIVKPDNNRVQFNSSTIYYGRLDEEGVYKILVKEGLKASIDVNLFSEIESNLTLASSQEAAETVKPWLHEVRGGCLAHKEIIAAVIIMLLVCWAILDRRAQ